MAGRRETVTKVLDWDTSLASSRKNPVRLANNVYLGERSVNAEGSGPARRNMAGKACHGESEDGAITRG